MATALDRGWGNPKTGDFSQRFVSISAGGIKVSCHQSVAAIFTDFLTELAKHYPLAGYKDDWGAVIRPIRGYEDEYERTHDVKYLSNHSWGLALDLDSSVNPMTKDAHAQHEFKKNVIDPILARYDGLLIWGGEYAGVRKDYMHFEFNGTPSEASKLATKLKHPSKPPVAEEDDMDSDQNKALVETRKIVAATDGRVDKLDTKVDELKAMVQSLIDSKV